MRQGTRITVADVFDYLGGGMSIKEMLDDFPDLTEQDIQGCFAYAAEGIESWLFHHMKLLFDENLSPRLPDLMTQEFPRERSCARLRAERQTRS